MNNNEKKPSFGLIEGTGYNMTIGIIVGLYTQRVDLGVVAGVVSEAVFLILNKDLITRKNK